MTDWSILKSVVSHIYENQVKKSGIIKKSVKKFPHLKTKSKIYVEQTMCTLPNRRKHRGCYKGIITTIIMGSKQSLKDQHSLEHVKEDCVTEKEIQNPARNI